VEGWVGKVRADDLEAGGRVLAAAVDRLEYRCSFGKGWRI
jgi:hypothetical protein